MRWQARVASVNSCLGSFDEASVPLLLLPRHPMLPTQSEAETLWGNESAMNVQALAAPVSLSAQVASGAQGGREWHLDDPLGPQRRDD